jgi:hypothetical protein
MKSSHDNPGAQQSPQSQQSDESHHDPHHDLKHFLRLATMQLQHRLKSVDPNESYSESVRRMRILEELLKEQVPDENSRNSARPTR